MTRELDDPERDGPFEPLPPEVERALVESLRAAFDPTPLDPERHRQILERALVDPLAPATDDEIRESARLRQALEQDDATHPDAALARALRHAVEPTALRPGALPGAAKKTSAGRGRVVYATFGAVALAAAAAFALFVSRPRDTADAGVAAARSKLVASRPTGELFAERFEPGASTERIDRIASARERDLRDNRYALWGVR